VNSPAGQERHQGLIRAGHVRRAVTIYIVMHLTWGDTCRAPRSFQEAASSPPGTGPAEQAEQAGKPPLRPIVALSWLRARRQVRNLANAHRQRLNAHSAQAGKQSGEYLPVMFVAIA
jgi:hypothetical protein